MKVIEHRVRAPFAAFRDRRDAGQRLGDAVGLGPDPAAVVFAVPRGGILVGEPIAKALEAPLCPVFCRKLPLPSSPEAGFGAVTLDGSVALNDPLVRRAGLDSERVDEVVDEVLEEVRRRADEYDRHAPRAEGEGRNVYLVDDGLATGYTIMAAAKMAQRQNPERLTLLVPVSPEGSIRRIESFFDDLWCLISQESLPFAVASYYKHFPELTDTQVKTVLERSNAWTTENSDARA